jgi:hypothetical protein
LEGIIESGTVDLFRKFLRDNSLPPRKAVYLSSPGGNLSEGMELGKLIRERRFDTVIGSVRPWSDAAKRYDFGLHHSIWPSACMSSCTFAFLGGDDRRVHESDLYGVHRLYLDRPADAAEVETVVQQGLAAVLSYVRSMGVDPALIEDMVKEGRTAVLGLSIERMVALRVVTGSKIATTGAAYDLSCGAAGMTKEDYEETTSEIVKMLIGNKKEKP